MSMIAQEFAEETRKQLKDSSTLNFAYVICEYDEADGIYIDSVWTNENDAMTRMWKLEQINNEITQTNALSKYSYKLHGYSKKFPYPDGCYICKEFPDGTIADRSFGIFCRRAFLNNEDFLKPFNLDEFKRFLKRIER